MMSCQSLRRECHGRTAGPSLRHSPGTTPAMILASGWLCGFSFRFITRRPARLQAGAEFGAARFLSRHFAGEDNQVFGGCRGMLPFVFFPFLAPATAAVLLFPFCYCS